MVSIFKDRSPVTIFWLFLLSLAVHSQFFIFFPEIQAREDNGLLSIVLNTYVAQLNPSITIVLYHLVVLSQAVTLNSLFANHRMYSTPSYLPAMVYIMLTGIMVEWSNITPALIANYMVIWLFTKTIRLYNNPNPKSLLFNVGLVIGGSVILYHPSAMLVLVAFFALLIVRPFVLAEVLVLLMGVVCPYYFLVSWLYLTDNITIASRFIPNWELTVPQISITPVFFITLAIVIFSLVTGIIYWQTESRRLVIQIRKNWVVLWSMLFVLLPTPFIHYKAGIISLLLWIVPASPFIAKGFLASKSPLLPRIMFWAILLLVVLKNWRIIA